ncbi:hypothetical protein QDS01_05105 [Acinetobacter nosocomialis]|uniref:hypothetical protein n=1 Tax=Acinetobacter nosocomialis TaxID=106654 RepID=UPI00244CD4CB|nr:hypothetical protein [Acinetobacter nosocomialis]MDH2634313.1 hypothetical protein [Acinetobacter nosocomialis]
MQNQKDLNIALESEVFGKILFLTAAQHAKTTEQQYKWKILAQLESQTLDRFKLYLQQQGLTATIRPHIKLQAKISGLTMAKLPWKLAMQLLKYGTNPFIKVFKRMKNQADEPDQIFVEYLLKHEYALAEFARLEINGEHNSSLKPVLDLI